MAALLRGTLPLYWIWDEELSRREILRSNSVTEIDGHQSSLVRPNKSATAIYRALGTGIFLLEVFNFCFSEKEIYLLEKSARTI